MWIGEGLLRIENLTLSKSDYLSVGLFTESTGHGKKGMTFTGSQPSEGIEEYFDHTTLFTLRHPLKIMDAEAMNSNMTRILCLIFGLFLLFGSIVSLLSFRGLLRIL